MSSDLSLVAIFNVLLRHRRAIAGAVFLVTAFVIGLTLLSPRTYTSTASFLPQAAEDQASRLAGIAAQFGIVVPSADGGPSAEFYADLLKSRELLRVVATEGYRVSGDDGGEPLERDLVSLLGIERESRAEAVEATIERLRQEVTQVTTRRETGMIEVSVTTRWPTLSQRVAERMVDLVNRFNLERRQTQGAAEREFIEEQLAQAEAELLAAEDSLQAFLQRNRRYENDPELRFQAERLRRRVNLRQQLFVSLSQAYEDAKIQEVRNTPVITVVDAPGLPARPDPRRLALKGALAVLMGLMLGALWAFAREMIVSTRRAEPDDYAEFARLKAEAADDLRRAGRLFHRMGGGQGGG